jgi:hypothetical protein
MIEKALKSFAELLERRIRMGTCSSEDSVRYTFFAALLQEGLAQERVVLEAVHPGVSGAKIDTVVLGGDRKPAVAIEFKFDRATPGGTNQPLPQKAGALFHDFVRLLSFRGDLSRYLIYVTDGELAGYLTNPRNGLASVFELREDGRVSIRADFFSGRSATFRDAMGRWPCDAVVRCLMSRTVLNAHYVRVYRVAPA